MPARTYKLIELVGISQKSFADAANNAVKKAAESLKGLGWFEVVEERGLIKNGRIDQYQVKVKIAFQLMSSDELEHPDEAEPPKKRR